MATQASLDLVQKLYVAYYGRPADPAGQQYWAEQIDEQGVDSVINFFGTSPEFDARFGSMSNEQLVNNLYFQLFGRSAEPEGLAFYAGHLDAGNLTLAEIALTIATGAQNEDVAALNNKLAVAQSFTNAIDDPNEITAYQGNDAANTARQFLVNVNENTDASAVDVEGFLAQLVRASGDPSTQNVFTLTELPSQTETTLVVGENGVPAEMALAFLQDVAQLDLVKEGLLDSDGNLTSGIGNITIEDNTDGTAQVIINTADGDLLSFAFDGNLALFAQVLFSDFLDTEETTTQTGIVLTTTQNNGGAFESGYTTVANDLIVAGRPELLHGAYIDGGGGYNTLEVDMKGFFAQPFQLLNIQEVHVQNMPNVYDLDQTILAGVLDRDDDFSANFPLPNLPEGADSVLDLSRARDLEKVVVNESGNTFGGLTGNQMLGNLHIAGIKGDAVVRLEGNFHQEVNLYYGRGLGDAVELELANVTMSSGDLTLGHNAGAVNLLSEGRLNVIESADFGDFLRELNISGSGELVIDDALEFAFGEVTIDASANTGGIRLNIDSVASDDNLNAEIGFSDELSEVTIKGSQARDVIEITGTADGVYLDIDMGAGRDTLILDGVDAGRGSKIAGSELTLHIMNDVDLDLVNIDDVTVDRVVLHAGSELTLNQEQFAAWGGVLETNHRDTAEIEVIISEDTSLSELMTGFDLDSNIKLNLIVEKGATLTLTAEELHKYVAFEGIDADMDGHLVITDAGLGFRVTDQSDYATGGTLANYSGSAMQNITIERDASGYERPAKDQNTDILVIDSTDTDGVVVGANDLPGVGDDTDAFSLNVGTLVMQGDQAITFDAPVEFLSNNWTIDFSELSGSLNGLFIQNFETINVGPVADHGQIIGNPGVATRIDVDLSGAGNSVGSAGNENGLKSSGVETYVVHTDGADNQFFVCDQTKDLQTLGLQGQGSITFSQINWGVSLLLEGDGAEDWNDLPKANGNPDESSIGSIVANYFHPGATVDVAINNQGQALGVTSTGEARPLVVESIEINNAKTINVSIDDGNAVIKELAGDEVETLNLTSDFDVTLQLDNDNSDLNIDASGVAGDATLVITDNDVDLADAELSGIDAVVMEQGSDLTLTIEQVQDIGAENFSLADGATAATLNIGNYDGQAFDFGSLDLEGINVATVTTIEGEFTVDPATDFTGIGQLVIPEGANVTISAEQFKQLVESGATIETQGTAPDTGSLIVDMDGDLTIGADDEVTIHGSNVTFAMADGEVLNVEILSLADGLQVTGDADAATKPLVNFLFDSDAGPNDPFTAIIDVAGYQDVDVRILDALLNNFESTPGVNSQAIEQLLENLDMANILNIYAEEVEVTPASPHERDVVVEPDASPEGITFEPAAGADFLRRVELTLQADEDNAATVAGDILLEDGEFREDFTLLTINTQDLGGATGPVSITGDITGDFLTEVTINADVDLTVGGSLILEGDADNDTATITLTGDADVTVKEVVAGADIVNIVYDTTDFTGSFVQTGGSSALSGDVETLTFEGTGDVVIGTPVVEENDVVWSWGVEAPELTTVNAAEQSGDLTLVFGNVNGDSFSFTGGTGVNTVWLTAINEAGDVAPGLASEGNWSFDLSEAAAGSALRITDDVVLSNGGDLTLDLGDAVLEIDGNVDFRDLDNLVFEGAAPTIVLLDGATVRMTDEQFEAFEAAGGTITGDTVIEVTDELTGVIGTDLTEVRGATELQIDNGLEVTVTGEQALISRVYDDEDPAELGELGALGDAIVHVVVAEDIDLTPVSDMATLTMLNTGDEETFITVQLTAAEASQLAGRITRENEDDADPANQLDVIEVPAASGDFIDPDQASFFNGGEESLTAAVADGAQDSFNLSEVNRLVLDGDIVLSDAQLDQLFNGTFEGEIVKNGNSVSAVVTSGANLAQYGDNVDLVELVDDASGVTLSVDQAYSARVWDENPYQDEDAEAGERADLSDYSGVITVVVDSDADLRGLTLASNAVIQIAELEEGAALPTIQLTQEQLQLVEAEEGDLAEAFAELQVEVPFTLDDPLGDDPINVTRTVTFTNDDGELTVAGNAAAIAEVDGDAGAGSNLLDVAVAINWESVGGTLNLEQTLGARDTAVDTFVFSSSTVTVADDADDQVTITNFQAGDGSASDDVFDILDFSAFFAAGDFEAVAATQGDDSTVALSAGDITLLTGSTGTTIDDTFFSDGGSDATFDEEFDGTAIVVVQDAAGANAGVWQVTGDGSAGTGDLEFVQIAELTGVNGAFVAENFGIA